MKKTKYNNTEVNMKATIAYLIIAIWILIFLGIIFFNTLTSPAESNAMKFMILFVTGFLIIFMVLGLMSSMKGILKAKIFMAKSRNEIQKTNPYIYYRELPNNYGIGIATILIDSTIENEKDIVAVILDLCAKGYLHLQKNVNEYEVKILKPIDEKLLSNEKYILSLIMSNNIKDINYDEWFNYCMQDGIKLGLFNKKEGLKKSSGHFEKRTQKIKKISRTYVTTAVVLAIILAIAMVMASEEKITLSLAIPKIIGSTLVASIVLLIVLYAPMYLIPVMIVSTLSIGKEVEEQAYNLEILNDIALTKKGQGEVQKLKAFKEFIRDFGMFANKNPEEIVLWEYYLSYAQVFGLTKEILATGYKEVVQNASFEIENIDSFKLNQINLKQ